MGIELALQEKPIIAEGVWIRECCEISAEAELLLQEIARRISGEALVTAWQLQSIRWGRFQDGKIIWADGGSTEWDYLQEMRVYNCQAELHLIRKNDDYFLSRYITDTGETAVEYVDTIARLWGSHEGEAEEGLLEDKNRGLTIRLPKGLPDARYYGLVTRAYIGYDPQTQQAGFSDYRFVEVSPADMGGDLS